ncbi:MAG: phage major capsid protein [Rhizobiales bacterium]|nr:phage major capsid protein [Hyphomicrobiales bacterium]MBA68020.1 phage major capsid protein [Hyphomicrobiales bacterium]
MDMTHDTGARPDVKGLETKGRKEPGGDLETKVADGDIAAAFDEFMETFQDFREANDRRLDEIERRAAPDVISVEKVDRINRAIDEHKRVLDDLVLKRARPPLGRARNDGPGNEHKEAFSAYIRRGDEHELRQVEAKAMSIGSDPNGGYLVPDELDTEIGRRLTTLSPMRAIATVRQVSGAVLKKPFAISGMATGWVGETDARPQTNTAQLAELQFPTMELYAMPAATASLLDDAAIDVEAWIASEVEAAFAEQEAAAFITGDGESQPRGLVDYETIADGTWEWGKLGHVASGADGAFGTSPSDKLIDLIYALKAGYRQNGRFLMNRSTQAEIRKFKDADGAYLWMPPAAAGGEASLMGFPVTEAEAMPDIDSDALAIAFGDFRRGYLVVDRVGVRVLRDPYSVKPYVLFYTTKRVGGGVQNFEAIKLLKFAEA